MSRLSKESAFCSVASTSQEDPEAESSASASIRTLNVTLLSSEWKSTKGGVSTISRELAIEFAKHPNVEVSVYLPKCSEEDKKVAASHNVELIEAEELPGYEAVDWLASVPENHAMDCIIGHGVQLGRQIQLIKKQNRQCKWIQIVHTAPEDLGMYKSYEEAIFKGELKHQGEVKLCELADQVVAVGPKLADAFARYLRPSRKDQKVLTLTPSIFNEFLSVEQATEERRKFCVLVFGRGDSEDFKLKGYDIAVQAVAELKDTSYQLMFVGAPAGKEDEVANRLLQHGIPPSQLTVRGFKESRDQLANLFCEVDLAIMPSRTEGFGLTTLEALSSGLPVLVSDNSGLGVALKEVVYGSQCVVDSEDPKEWAKKIKAVREKSREVRLAESKLLREKYLEKFRWQQSCGLLLEKMQNLVFGSSETKGKKDKRPLPPFDNHPAKRPRRELSDCKELPRQMFKNLQQMQHHDVGKVFCKDALLARLERIVSNKGFVISDNEGSGNCMFYALCEQLHLVKGIAISPEKLRQSIVQYLRKNPKLPGGTDLFNFINGYPSWADYLTNMEQDGTWGDHIILLAVANCYETYILVISSQSDYNDVTISPDRHVVNTNPLLLGHIHEVHYVSLRPKQGSSKRETSAKVGSSSSSAQVTKQPRLLTGVHKGPARIPAQPSEHGKRSSPSGTWVPNQKRLLTREDKESSERGTSATSPNHHRLSTDSDTGHGLSMFLSLLKAEYDRRSLLKPLLWENTFKLPLEEVYTRLSIVSRRKTDFKLESGEVNLYDVFKFLNKGEDTMVLVEGSPGIGKTTFCLKISHDWTNEKIPNDSSFAVFKLLLLLKCRDIHGDVMEAISEQLLPEDTDVKITKEIMDYIKDIHNQKKILIILDGLDELPKTAESHVDKLLFRRVLPFCYVLCTSRQETGIVVRQKFDFDILLQIEGFTEQDAFEYIRKHFSHLDSSNLSKGERLIEAIQENTLLHALLNNPLNLLLLCVVFEDYQGELPSFRTELYQIIVRCLLRRYCAKHKLEAPCDVQALEKQFEKSLLVLGELAWRCLQEDRFCFREEELAKFESENEHLVARELGLVFKEASMKKINPQHEYHFFHKTFQEYLAATYLAHKLLKEEANVFCEFELDFQENVTDEYRQVFLFVSGILGKDATVLFKQIGETLNASEHWDWLKCSTREATFFRESFNESCNAEQMAMTLCSFIPFPLTVEINLLEDEEYQEGDDTTNTNILMVAEACSNFPQLQHPVHLTVKISEDVDDGDLEMIAKFLESCPKLETFSCCIFQLLFRRSEPDLHIFEGLSKNSTISSFTFRAESGISFNLAANIGNSLAAIKTLRTVTFELVDGCNEAWASAVERGLSADTPLSSLVLKIYGSLTGEAVGPLQKVLSNRSLSSVAFIIYGEMQDSLATALGETLAAESILKSLTLIVYGKISNSGAISLERGFLENSALNSLEVKVFGELPDNWVTVVEKVIEAKKSKMSVAFHPINTGTISETQVARLRPNFELKSLTLNLWGELSFTGADTLCNLLMKSSTPCVTLNIHGKVTNSVAERLVSYLKPCKTLSSLSMNIWGELSKSGNSSLQELKCSVEYSFALKVCSVASDPWICKDVNYTIDVPSPLISVLTKVELNCASINISDQEISSLDCAQDLEDVMAKNRSLSLTFRNNSDLFGDWTRGLGDGLAKNTSLATLHVSITFNKNSVLSGNSMRGLGDGLAKNTSLTTLSLTFNNYSDLRGDWMRGLGDGLAKNTSLTTLHLSLAFIDCSILSGDWTRGLGDGLAKNTSLTRLHVSLTFKNDSDLSEDLTRGLGDGLAKNTSLTTLHVSLAFINDSDLSEDWMRGLGDGLAKNTSLTILSLKFNNYSDLRGDWMRGLGDGLAKNTSLTTLSLTFNNDGVLHEDWTRGLGDGLAKNTSLTTLHVNLSFNYYNEQSDDWMDGLGDGLAKNTSLTTLHLSLAFERYSGLREDWTRGLGDGLAKNTSLTTLHVNLSFNYYNEQSDDWMDGLGDGLAKNTSLTTLHLSLAFNEYSVLRKVWTRGLGDGLAKNTSLTTLNVSITFNKNRVLRGDWMYGVGDGLAKNTSLTTLCVTINNYSCLIGNWTHLGDGLAQNTSLTTLSLAFNNYSDLSGDWTCGLGDGLAKNTSLTTLSLTFNNYCYLSGVWIRGLHDGLAKNTSLIVVNITVNSTYLKVSEDWFNCICNSLAESNTLTALSFTFNDYSGTSEVLEHELRKHFSDCKLSPSLNLTVSLYGEAAVS